MDSSRVLTLDDVIQQADQFILTHDQPIPYELSNHPVWLKLFIQNKGNQPIKAVVFADNAMLSNFIAYDISEIQSDITAIDQPNNLAQLTFPHVAFEVAAQQQSTLLLKVQSLGVPNIPIILYEQSEFENRQQITQLLYGAFIGIVFVIALYNLVLFFAVQDKIHLVYISYLLSALLVLSSVNGLGYYIHSVAIQQWLNEHVLLFHYFLAAALLAFSLLFLRYDRDKPPIYWVGLSFCSVLLILAVVTQFISHELQAKIFFSLEPVFYLFTLYLVFSKSKASFSWSKFYLFSWLPLSIGAAIQPLVLLNLIEYSFLTRNAFLFGVLLEIIFMSLALAERMRRFEYDRVAAISYHPKILLPRKVVLERKIAELITQQDNQFYVLAIKPELIEKISVYIEEPMLNQLYKHIGRKLTPLFAYNDAILPLTEKQEKVAIVSGEYMVVIVDKNKLQQSLEIICHSINQLVGEAYQINDLKLPLYSVIGISAYPKHGSHALALLNQAVLAVKHAQQTRQPWCLYDASKYQRSDEDLALAININQAISENNFVLYHQPQVDLSTKRVCGSEVLLRWYHPDYGNVSPERLIAIAENFGLISKLSIWIIEQALKHQSTLREQGFNHHISVNISSEDVVSELFYEQVIELLEIYQVRPGKLVLELAESSSLIHDNAAMGVITKFAGIGVIISLDDYGTASASVAYISNLPFKELKVDQRFIAGIHEDSHRHIIVKSAVMLAKGLGLEVVAEGIRNEEDESMLRSFGCDLGQGYFYAQPMPFADYLDWLKTEVGGHAPPPLTGEFIPKENS